MRPQQIVQRGMMRLAEPIEMAHLNRELHLARPRGEELLQVVAQLGRIARRELQEQRAEPRAEVAHQIDEALRLAEVRHQLPGVTDTARQFGAEAKIGRSVLAQRRTVSTDGVAQNVVLPSTVVRRLAYSRRKSACFVPFGKKLPTQP